MVEDLKRLVWIISSFYNILQYCVVVEDLIYVDTCLTSRPFLRWMESEGAIYQECCENYNTRGKSWGKYKCFVEISEKFSF
jgi:hypothetical protein